MNPSAIASVQVDPRIPAAVPGFDAPFFQAGLAGYSDAAMRIVARRHGCPYCVTEALLDQTLISGGKGRRREDPNMLRKERGIACDDHPIGGQIIGTDEKEMAEGAEILCGMGYDAIDVNLACPVKKIRRRMRGGHFLGQPTEAVAVLRAVREIVPASLPTTVKLRRGFDDTDESVDNFRRILDAAFDLGYAWATVHARTVMQKYVGPSQWPFLAELTASMPDALIFGSGDIWTAEDIFRMMKDTGVRAVSVARGCIGNPWIFRQARELMSGKEMSPPTLAEQRSVLLEHFELSMALHGERAASRMMRKFGIKFSQHHPRREPVREAFIAARTAGEWHEAIDMHYSCT